MNSSSVAELGSEMLDMVLPPTAMFCKDLLCSTQVEPDRALPADDALITC